MPWMPRCASSPATASTWPRRLPPSASASWMPGTPSRATSPGSTPSRDGSTGKPPGNACGKPEPRQAKRGRKPRPGRERHHPQDRHRLDDRRAATRYGSRTEEMRALSWNHIVAYDGDSGRLRPITEIGWGHGRFAVHVWRSVRASGDTKTRKSRRTLALSKRCVRVLQAHQERQGGPARATEGAPGGELVFVTATGRQLDKDTVRRAFRKVTAAAGLHPREWAPRELRHTFLSVLSDNEIPIEKISDLVGHSDTTTTETIYRFQIRPAVLDGAEAMDRIFPAPEAPQAR